VNSLFDNALSKKKYRKTKVTCCHDCREPLSNSNKRDWNLCRSCFLKRLRNDPESLKGEKAIILYSSRRLSDIKLGIKK
jgi:hypothetical protein